MKPSKLKSNPTGLNGKEFCSRWGRMIKIYEIENCPIEKGEVAIVDLKWKYTVPLRLILDKQDPWIEITPRNRTLILMQINATDEPIKEIKTPDELYEDWCELPETKEAMKIIRNDLRVPVYHTIGVFI